MSYTTADLITSIERRSFTPTNQSTFDEEDLLEMADEEMRGVIVPSIVRLREDYFVRYSDVSIASGQRAYAIPSRAVGMVVRNLAIVDAANAVTPLTRAEIERLTSYNSGSPESFYFEGNNVILTPTPNTSSGSLRIHYALAPSSLVETSETAVISAIDTTLNTVTVTSIPSTWVTGNVFDLTKQDGGQEPLSIDLTSTDITSNVITLPSLPSTLRVGDYVSLAGKTSLPQVPAEYRDVLAQAVAARILGDMGQARAERAQKRLESLLGTAETLFKPRNIGESSVILTSHWE